MSAAGKKPRLTLFDLDHTLLTADSDVLWCEFLMAHGVLERESFAARNADMEARYKAGTVGVAEFAGFYVSTLAGRSPAQWQPLREQFLHEVIVPCVAPRAPALVREHLDAGDLVVLTTATNRFITELTAQHFGIEHLLATECEVVDGVFTGRTEGVHNMREGKVTRLQAWLAGRGFSLPDLHSTAYSDSINDLALLSAADVAVAVDPEPRLKAAAQERGWRVVTLR
ncbi:HAD family hydrolase [Ramlibacter sp.]|uniref:HAD family hydrolase n=1 Tax=Ramlibacter sp. TaxID=1917967 RepID=UPI0035AE0E2C